MAQNYSWDGSADSAAKLIASLREAGITAHPDSHSHPTIIVIEQEPDVIRLAPNKSVVL